MLRHPMQHYKAYTILGILVSPLPGRGTAKSEFWSKHGGVNCSGTTKASKLFSLNSAFRILFSEKQDRALTNVSTDKRLNGRTASTECEQNTSVHTDF